LGRSRDRSVVQAFLRRHHPDQVRGVSRLGEISVPRGTPPARSRYIARPRHCQKRFPAAWSIHAVHRAVRAGLI